LTKLLTAWIEQTDIKTGNVPIVRGIGEAVVLVECKTNFDEAIGFGKRRTDGIGDGNVEIMNRAIPGGITGIFESLRKGSVRAGHKNFHGETAVAAQVVAPGSNQNVNQPKDGDGCEWGGGGELTDELACGSAQPVVRS